MIEYKLDTCPRCGGAHPGLKFRPLAKAPGEANHWATCPTTKEPIMAKVVLHLVETWGGPPDAKAARPDPGRRTKAQVEAERANGGSCCDRHADRMACDCLREAAD